MPYFKRMWINASSQSNPLHKYNGTNVLVMVEDNGKTLVQHGSTPGYTLAAFTHGPSESTVVRTLYLSEGWRHDTRPGHPLDYDKAPDSFERWMIERGVKDAKEEGLEAVLIRLHNKGYHWVANKVERIVNPRCPDCKPAPSKTKVYEVTIHTGDEREYMWEAMRQIAHEYASDNPSKENLVIMVRDHTGWFVQWFAKNNRVVRIASWNTHVEFNDEEKEAREFLRQPDIEWIKLPDVRWYRSPVDE